jgi:uncharacterized membrane protein YuzA (DUF378 family)
VPRPRSVTLLALLVLSIAAFNTLGLVSGITRYTLLSHLPLSLPPAVPIISSIFWAAAFGLLAYGLWRLKQWARRGTPLAVALYLAQFWFERLLFGQSDYIRMTIWFYVGLHAVILMLFWGSLLRPKVRQAFAD